METIHLIGAEDVRRAGNEISSAADQIQRAASGFDNSAERLTRQLEDHAMRVCDALATPPAKPALRRVIVSKRTWVAPGKHDVAEIGPALFHCWGTDFEEFEGGPGNTTVAVVEFPDGTIATALPTLVRFEVQP
jgi:hypothetical protein